MGLRRAFTRASSAPAGPRPVPASRHGAFGGLGNLLDSTGGQPWEVFGYSGLELYRGVMSIPAFWRGANLLSDLIAQVPWDAYTTHGRDQETLIDPRPVLLEQPTPPLTRYSVFKAMFLDYKIHGNAIALITTRDSLGRPTSIQPVPALWAWTRRITSSNASSTYLPIGAVEYSIAGRSYDSSEVLHIMGPSAPGARRGFGVLEAHFAGALDTAHQLQREAKKASRHGVPPGYIKYTGPDPVDPADLAEARDEWMAKRDAGGVAALNANLDFQAVSWNPNESQLIEARQMSLNEMANLLGLPATFVNSSNSGSSSLTYATVDSEALGLLKWSCGGDFEQWSQTLSLLFPRGTCVRPDLDHFLKGDTQARYSAYAAGIGAGWLLRSEVRKMERLPVVAGIDDQPLPKKAEVAVEKGDPEALSVAQVPPPGAPVKAIADRLPELPGQRAVSHLQLTEQGRQLWNYWTGEGKALWAAAEHPYDTLRAELAKERVPAHEIDGEAATIFHAVFHMTPGQRAELAGKKG
jgi:HK97 family phage portal protein